MFYFSACRGSIIRCVVYTMSMTNYPPIINPETGKPTGQNWDEMHIEYAWSKRDSNVTTLTDQSTSFDYPVSLFLRTYQMNTTSAGSEYRSAEVEYEFYEMSTELPYDAFDFSVCYRSRDWPYLHLAFTVKLDKDASIVDSNHLNRKELYNLFLLKLQEAMNPILLTRIHQLEIDHDVTSATDTLYISFLLLGPTPMADSIPDGPSSITKTSTDQISVETARDRLRAWINDGNFNINVQLLDSDHTNVNFKAVPNSLQNIREFLASHPLIFNVGNKTVLQTNTINITQTFVQTLVISEEKIMWTWSKNAQTAGIVGGLLIGLGAVSIMILAIKLMKKKTISSPLNMIPMTSITNITYNKRQETVKTNVSTATTMANSNTSNA